MLPETADEVVIRLRGVLVDNGYGDQIIDWSSPSTSEISGCSVQGLTGVEVLLSRDAVINRRKWFGPPDADLTSLDRIRRRDGSVYNVNGPVVLEQGLGLDHKWCFLEWVEG